MAATSAETRRIRRAARGDRKAARALVDAHGPLVFGMCRRLAPDPEDCYQEVWEKVFAALPAFDPAGSAPLRGWIATITRRHLTDRHRRRSVRGEVVPLDPERDADPGPSAEDRAVGRERSDRLEAALLRLPPDQRHVVVQHHIHGVELAVLADESGVAVGTIKSRLHRGRARLSQLLGSSS